MDKCKQQNLFTYLIKKPLDFFNLVTREEFDIQTQVLLKTRKKVQELEEKLASLALSYKESESDGNV